MAGAFFVPGVIRVFLYGFSLFKMSTQRVGILNYNPPASRVVTIVIRKNHLSVLYVLGQVTFKSQLE